MRASHSHSYRQVPSMSPPCEAQPRRPRESGSSVRRERGCGSGLGARGVDIQARFDAWAEDPWGPKPQLHHGVAGAPNGKPTVHRIYIIPPRSPSPDPLSIPSHPRPPSSPHIDIGTARYTHPIKRTLSIVLSQPPSTLTMKTTTVAAVLASAAGANAQWFGQAPECAVRLTPQHALCNPST